jgi:hypothetical protein
MRASAAPFAAAITLASFLLFIVEPLLGKRLLPLLGGSAAVWITCLVFFQTALLLGYLCAHCIARLRSSRAQALLYAALIVAALVQSGLALPSSFSASTAHPIVSVFSLLSLMIGLPFVALSATSPLLQAWYARAGANGASSRTYSFYALSNIGSLLGLVLYPAAVEPLFGLRHQSRLWLFGFALMVFAAAAVIARVRSLRSTTKDSETPADISSEFRTSAFPHFRSLLWFLLAMCGSVLLCSVTGLMTQRVAPIPLLWVVALVVYLLSFILAFAGERFYPRKVVLALLPVALAAIAYVSYDPDLPHDMPKWVRSLTRC